MSFKDKLKAIWHGVKVALPYLGIAAGLLTGTPVGLALLTIEQLISQAEDIYAGSGTGPQKAAYVTEQALIAMEAVSGKNVNNPKTRALVGKITDNVVATKNAATQLRALEQEYAQLAKDLKDAIDSVKEPAIPDAP